MKKQFTATAMSLICIGSANAQSLFDLAPSNDDTEPSPLTWTAGAGIGYDDNAVPGSDDGDDSFYGNAYVGASFLSRTPATTTEFFARLGIVHYFDDIDGRVEQTSPTVGFGFNWTQRISDRLRFVSRNTLAYELEPDYSEGFQAVRSDGNYLRWSSDNAVGYRSDRLQTYTGVRYEDVSYDEFEDLDRSTITFYHDFRIPLNDKTVATVTYRHSEVDGGSFSDSSNDYFLVGLEHRFSPSSVASIKAGVQVRDVDDGDNSSSPYVEAAVRAQIDEDFRIRAYARYGIEDYSRSVSGNTFEGSEALRLGITGIYDVNEKLSVNGGVNFINLQHVDPSVGNPSPGEIDEDTLDIFVGFRFQISDTVSVDGKYSFTTLSSDNAFRDYDRNRVSVGVSATF